MLHVPVHELLLDDVYREEHWIFRDAAAVGAARRRGSGRTGRARHLLLRARRRHRVGRDGRDAPPPPRPRAGPRRRHRPRVSMAAVRQDDFRAAGHTLVDWVADYLERVGELPVFPPVEPGWVRTQLPPHPPEHGEPWDEIVADLDRVVVPGLTHWQSPNFFGYFPANASGPAILGDLVSSGPRRARDAVGDQPGVHRARDPRPRLAGRAPRPTRTVPQRRTGGGVIQDSASSANLCAVLAARDRTADDHEPRPASCVHVDTGALVDREGDPSRGSAPRPTQAHRRRPHLRHAARRARSRRSTATSRDDLVPFIVVGTVGHDVVARHRPHRRAGRRVRTADRLWLHVDAAMAGAAAVVPELRPLVNDGLERVDSWCFDPHKWLLTNFDCDVLYLADRRPLIKSLSVLPEYLRNQASESGAVIDYRDWHIPLGRRFRALKLWFVIRHYGAEGLRAHIENSVASARWLAQADRRRRSLRTARAHRSVARLLCSSRR